MSKVILAVAGAAVLITGGFFVLNNYIYEEKQVDGETPGIELATYANPEFSMRHSEEYIAVEPAEGAETRVAVSFYLKEDWEEFQRAPENREGPVAVTVEMFLNEEGLSPEAWAASDSRSNLPLGSGDYVAVEVNGVRGIAYGWSGLHEGLSVALGKEQKIYVVSVTYLSLDERIVNDFPGFLETFEIAQAS